MKKIIRKILREEFKNNKLIDGMQSIIDQTIDEIKKLIPIIMVDFYFKKLNVD